MSVLPFTIYHSPRFSGSRPRTIVILVTLAVSLAVLTFFTSGVTFDCIPSAFKAHDRAYPMHTNVVIGNDGRVFKYDRYSPLIFISGTNLSGTEMLRDILNTHPDIRCSSEKQYMARLLGKHKLWFKHQNESVRLSEAGINQQLMEAAIGAFSLEIMVRSGPPVDYLCNEDYHSVKFAQELSGIFPKSKFLLVVRDPMHYAHLKTKDHNFSATVFNEYLRKWDIAYQHQRISCNIVLGLSSRNGPRCKIVIFEQLFLRPTSVILPVLEFIFANESLHYIPYSMHSSLRPGLNDDLLEWVDHVPEDIAKAIRKNGPDNFVRFGYDQLGYPPNYHLMRWL